MILKNKKALIFSSLLTLLPILTGLLLWDKFPERMTTHWGFDGQADGYGSVPFAVFVPPLIMLAAQWLCIWATAKDPGNKDRNRKPLTLMLWIIPILSNLCCGIMYALALGAELSVEGIMCPAIGLMFAVIGNYLPKCKMNSTMGIKVPWAYTSEENWNATHRMAGKIWVIGGLVIAFSGLLPGGFGITILLIALLFLSFLPIVYSYAYYRRQKARDDALIPLPKMAKSGIIAVVLLLIFLVVILFTGELGYVFHDDSLTIEASFYDDLTVSYAAIDSIEYREGNVPGLRVGGFGSLRLLMGYFENGEFGTYTRYTYYKPEACVVLTSGEKTLVLSGKDAAETQTIYDTLLTKIN